MYNYLKALHIIFVVTWFAGLFYMPRLLIYNTEAGDKPAGVAEILRGQFTKMLRPLWYGITWPSALLTLILGITVLFKSGWYHLLGQPSGNWLLIKLFFVLGLYGYHLSLHMLFLQQMKGVFRYTSQQLRIWNEVATVFLVAIVMLVVVKENMSWAWGLTGLILLIILLMLAIKVYKIIRSRK